MQVVCTNEPDVIAAGRAVRIAVVVASVGRPLELRELFSKLALQTRRADKVVLSIADPGDAPESLPDWVEIVMGERGLAHQRNRGLERCLGECDIVAFFDDDYLPSRRALQGISAFFTAHPDVAGINGRLLADGINSEGLSYREAMELIEEYETALPERAAIVRELEGLYGCHMVFRAAAIGPIRFDERLPLYAWQEDIDFAARVRANGRILQTTAFAGVHRGVKRGRMTGVRLGFSQVVNPLYLVRKGTMRPAFAARLIIRNLLANHARALFPEPWVDRKGRALGNWRGIAHVLTTRPDPAAVVRVQ